MARKGTFDPDLKGKSWFHRDLFAEGWFVKDLIPADAGAARPWLVTYLQVMQKPSWDLRINRGLHVFYDPVSKTVSLELPVATEVRLQLAHADHSSYAQASRPKVVGVPLRVTRNAVFRLQKEAS